MVASVESGTTKRNSVSAKKLIRLDRIYHTAAEIIYRDGYEAATLSDIAKAVGLTKAGLYHYVRSKENLLFAIMTYGMDRVKNRVIEPTIGISDPAARIRAIVSNYAKLISESGPAITIIITEPQGLTPERNEQILSLRRNFYRYVRDTIRELNKFDSGPDPSIIANSVFSVLLSFAQWYRPDGRLSLEQIVDQITELTVDRMIGLGPADGSGANIHSPKDNLAVRADSTH